MSRANSIGRESDRVRRIVKDRKEIRFQAIDEENRSPNPPVDGPKTVLYKAILKEYLSQGNSAKSEEGLEKYINQLYNNNRGYVKSMIDEYVKNKENEEQVKIIAEEFKAKNPNVAHLVNGWLGIPSDNSNKPEEKGDEVR